MLQTESRRKRLQLPLVSIVVRNVRKVLPRAQTLKKLGVIVTSGLCPQAHVWNAYSSDSTTLGGWGGLLGVSEGRLSEAGQ